MSTTTAARKPLIDNTIANTDTQSLSISGHTISLTNGGSVTVPDNYRSISDSISSTSTSVSASSKAVKIAYDKGNHPHPYLPLSGGTLTGDLVISKTSPMLRLYDTNASIGNYPRIDFDTANNQGASIEFNEFDAELPIAGYGLVVGPSTTNTQFPTTGTLSLSVLGEIYAGGTSLKGLNKVFHDGYHPNADKWTTARTLSLTGDVTGSVSWDGSGNASLTATVADDSHNHTWNNIDGGSVNSWGGLRHSTGSGYIEFGPGNTYHAHIYTDRPNFYFNRQLLVNGSTVWHSSNDGSGSGLDADKLDGIQASQFLRSDTNTFFNSATNSRKFYITRGSATSESLGFGIDDTVAYIERRNDETSSNIRFNLIATDTESGGGANANSGTVDFIQNTSGTSINVNDNKVWHAGNDGSGSGLDADKLDGLHASQFLRSDASDTISGNLSVNGNYLKFPTGTSDPSSNIVGSLYYNTLNGQLKMYNGNYYATIKGFKDGSTPSLAADNATDIRELGITTSGVYWINIPGTGPTQVYCDMEIDGGGWMMFAYAGSTSGVGNTNHMVFNTIGSLATSRVYGQTSFSRFDYASALVGAGKGISSMMWKRTTDINILAHEVGEMWDRLPGNSQAGDRNFGGSTDLNYDMEWMKMSNTGGPILDEKLGTAGAGIRYEYGPAYPAISWNSTYNNNSNVQGGYNLWLNRRALIYWETNGPESQGQWFHGEPLKMASISGAYAGRDRKDVEIYFRVRDPKL